MQAAGGICGICGLKILFESEGTWCARCRTQVHTDCLSARGRICPVCVKEFDDPKGHVRYSLRCPACRARNDPPDRNCRVCGNQTAWESEANYLVFKEHVRRSSRRYVLIGLASIGLGLLTALMLLFQLFGPRHGPSIIFVSFLGFSVVTLVNLGINKFLAGWGMRDFE
jgi:hypothetical protein